MKPEPFGRIYALADEHVAQIKERLRTGESPMSVARHIRDEWGLWHDVKPETAEKQLLRFRRKVVLRVSTAVPARLVQDGLRAAVRHIDVFEKMGWLAEVQLGRVEKARLAEEKMPLLTGMLSRELVLLRDILKSLAWMYLETGRLPKALKIVAAVVETAGGVEDPTFFGFHWTPRTEELYQRIVDSDPVEDTPKPN